MIVIASAVPRERAAFAALCTGRGWVVAECDSVRAVARLFRRTRPKILLTRHKLGDGYSDDLIALLAASERLPSTKVIILFGAGASSALVARQVALGADLVLRDPVRTDVLVEYLAKYHGSSKRAGRAMSPPEPDSYEFAGAIVRPLERQLQCEKGAVRLTPREADLVDLLVRSGGELVTYDTLYAEILGRPFQGDTSNLRVLLRKLDASFRTVGLSLRPWVEVIPKTGYRYRSVRTS